MTKIIMDGNTYPLISFWLTQNSHLLLCQGKSEINFARDYEVSACLSLALSLSASLSLTAALTVVLVIQLS